jgi:predicted ATPase
LAYASDRIGVARRIVANLKRRQLLFVLGNCEHLLEVSAEFAGELLQCCLNLRLLVTSREPLPISGELAWRAPSLATPDSRAIERPNEFVRYIRQWSCSSSAHSRSSQPLL